MPVRPHYRFKTALWLLVAVNLGWRLALLPVSQGSYTDGILQVDMVRQGVSFWPPFFPLLARLFALIPGLDLEGAGRAVALLCGVLILIPLAALARRFFGERAALWAMAVWTASPMALRWSLQGMSDMPMAALWLASLAALLRAVEAAYPECFPVSQSDSPADPPPPDARAANQWLLIAALGGALATLTRYQGIFLLPFTVLAAWALTRQRRGAHPTAKTAHPFWMLLPWLAAALWAVQEMGSLARHGAQISARTAAGGPWETLLNYVLIFEDFLLYTPYFLSYGLFGFILYGLFRTRWAAARRRWAGWTALVLTLAIVILQAVFQSFQERYLLPLVPLACLFAGQGLATWEGRQEGRPWRFWALAGPALAWGLLFSTLVAVLQGGPFLDLKQAAAYVRGLNRPETVRIAADEFYNQEIGPAKLRYWTGRTGVERLGAQPLAPGDLVILSSFYEGGLTRYRAVREQLIQTLPARELKHFSRYAWPLFPDLMQEAGTHQNPLALDFRYHRQYYETTVLEVMSPAGPAVQAPRGARGGS